MVEERRQADRVGKIATGQVLFGSKAIDCAILDASERGARLELATTKDLPAQFALKLTDGGQRDCKVVWRDENTVGVEFS